MYVRLLTAPQTPDRTALISVPPIGVAIATRTATTTTPMIRTYSKASCADSPRTNVRRPSSAARARPNMRYPPLHTNKLSTSACQAPACAAPSCRCSSRRSLPNCQVRHNEPSSNAPRSSQGNEHPTEVALRRSRNGKIRCIYGYPIASLPRVATSTRRMPPEPFALAAGLTASMRKLKVTCHPPVSSQIRLHIRDSVTRLTPHSLELR